MDIEEDALEVDILDNEFESEIQNSKQEKGTIMEENDEHSAMDIDECHGTVVDNDNGLDQDSRPVQRDEKIAKNGIHTKDEAPDDSKHHTKHKRKKSKNSRNEDTRSRYDRSTKGNKLYKILHASPDLDPKILGREIAYRLGEVKVGLIANVVRVLGFRTAMEILEETKRIERRGGMLTADKKRRRSPGGVFICCLKEDGFASKEQIDEIFKEEKERLKDILKRKRKEKNERQRKELQNMKQLKDRVSEIKSRSLEKEYTQLKINENKTEVMEDTNVERTDFNENIDKVDTTSKHENNNVEFTV